MKIKKRKNMSKNNIEPGIIQKDREQQANLENQSSPQPEKTIEEKMKDLKVEIDALNYVDGSMKGLGSKDKKILRSLEKEYDQLKQEMAHEELVKKTREETEKIRKQTVAKNEEIRTREELAQARKELENIYNKNQTNR